MKTILITGSSGFTGRYVAQKFEGSGYKVIRTTQKKPEQNEWQCELSDTESLERVLKATQPSGIIHLAGLAFVGHGDNSAFYQINTVGTSNLLQAIDTVGLTPEKIIIASSANVYGNPIIKVISEETAINPINHYAVSKVAMELMVKTWFERFPIAIVRPFNYTGIGQNKNFLIPKIVDHYCQRKKRIELGNLAIARDFSDVRDVAKAYFNLFESSVTSETINFCSGHTITLSEIMALMNKIAGYDIDIIVNPDFVRKNEIKTLCGDNQKMQKLLGNTAAIPFIETLKTMYYAGKA
ncbi:MAG: GDP-mannose 4,6-dehydratase [Methylococcales bacterium]|nr:GDP-mannose 4,6-dehydratase [Methylococcales bacterium]